MNKQQRRPQAMGLNIGSASIIMLFAVLCLTVLAALSLLSANSQYALSARSAEVTRAYYEAETKAAQIFELVKNGDLTGVETYESDGETLYSYSVDIDQFQEFSVILSIDDGDVQIRSWKIIEAGSWTPDDSVDIWDGEDIFDMSESSFFE